MVRIFLISLLLIISLKSCAKKKDDKLVSSQQNPYNVYEEGLEAFNKNDYFFAHKKFSESEIICSLSVIICFEAEEIRMCLVLDLRASIIRDGDRAVKINLEVEDVDSIIRLRYG